MNYNLRAVLAGAAKDKVGAVEVAAGVPKVNPVDVVPPAVVAPKRLGVDVLGVPRANPVVCACVWAGALLPKLKFKVEVVAGTAAPPKLKFEGAVVAPKVGGVVPRLNPVVAGLIIKFYLSKCELSKVNILVFKK